MEKSSDTIVVGSGLIGMLTAGSLARAGFKVVLMDKKKTTDHILSPLYDGRLIALTPATQKVFETIGLWPYLSDFVGVVSQVYVSWQQPNMPSKNNQFPAQLTFESRHNFGKPLGLMIPYKNLHKGLSDWMAQYPIQHYDQVFIHSVKLDCYGVYIEGSFSGEKNMVFQSALLVGSDGKNSFIRQKMNVTTHRWSYGETAFVATYEHDVAHGERAYEKFLKTGPFAILPLKNPHQSSIVWMVKEQEADDLQDLSSEEFDQRVCEHMGFLGNLKRLSPLQIHSVEGHFVPQFVQSRFCLVGDAAHGMNPLAGLGFNLGVSDVDNLISAIQRARSLGLDLGGAAILKEFQHHQRFNHIKFLLTTHGIHKLFDSLPIEIEKSRDWMLSVLDDWSTLKHFLLNRGIFVGEGV